MLVVWEGTFFYDIQVRVEVGGGVWTYGIRRVSNISGSLLACWIIFLTAKSSCICQDGNLHEAKQCRLLTGTPYVQPAIGLQGTYRIHASYSGTAFGASRADHM